MPRAGTFTALQQIKPDATKFSDLIKNAQDIDIKERTQKLSEEKEERLADIAERKQKLLEDADFDSRYGIDDEAILKTGFNSYDELMLPYAVSIKEEMWKTKEALRANPKNMKLQQKFSNLTNSIKTIKASNKSFTELLERYATLQEEGGVSGVHADIWLDLLQKYKEYKVIPTIDRKTGMTSMVYINDKKERVAISLQDMIDGNVQIYAFQDANKLSGQIADGLGVRKKDEVTGRFINTEIKFDGAVKEAARLAILAKLQTDEELADLLNQANGSMKDAWDVSTEEGQKERDKAVKTATDWMLKKVEGSYDTQDTLKERPLPRSTSTAGERTARQDVIDRNQTIADIQAGAIGQLEGEPAWGAKDKDGARTSVLIKQAAVTDDFLILTFSDGTSREIEITDKNAINEMLNKATGNKIDTDAINKLADETAIKSGDISEKKQVEFSDETLDFVNVDLISRKEDAITADRELAKILSEFDITMKQAKIGLNAIKLTAKDGSTIKIDVNERGKSAQKEIKRMKEFIREHGGTETQVSPKDKTKVKVSNKADVI